MGSPHLIEEPDPERASALFTSINRQTLGQLLARLHRSTDSAEHIESLLAAALAERNRLSHHFYRLHNFRRNSAEGCTLMLSDLVSIHETILRAYKAVLLLSGFDVDALVIAGHPTQHVQI